MEYMAIIDAEKLFWGLGGRDKDHLPAIPVPTYFTDSGISYLRSPYIALVGCTRFHPRGIQDYLEGFDANHGFANYLRDPWRTKDGTPIPDTALICKHAGQGCYGSWGPGRTTNAEIGHYLDRMKYQGHWSVLEHATFTFFIAGSRTMSMELNRHRHNSISQLSQRYVPKELVRFVERPEFQKHPDLHGRWMNLIEHVYEEYGAAIEEMKLIQDEGGLVGANKTSLKKNIQQASRAFLLGCTETSGYWSGNARTWRHVIDQRTSYSIINGKKESGVEPEIRDVVIRCLLCLAKADPILFGDYEIEQLDDGSYVTNTAFRGA